MTDIKLARTDDEILCCCEVMLALRPHVPAEQFLPTVKEMMQEGYQMAYIESGGKAVAVIGFRYLQFLYNGKHFYIDDLSTLPEHRSHGYAGLLLDFVAQLARDKGYATITLDSGHHRFNAHRLYLNKGFQITAHHFVKKIDPH